MATNSAYIQIATSNAYQFTNTSNNDLVIYPTVSAQQMLLGTSNNVYANMAITPSNMAFVVQGNTTSSKMTFNTNNNATVALTILGNGLIGAGTATPSCRLNVADYDGTSDPTQYGISQITQNNLGQTGKSNQAMLSFVRSGNAIIGLGYAFGSNTFGIGQGFNSNTNFLPSYICVQGSTGNVGIGTVTPGYALDVAGAINTLGGVIATGASSTSAQVFNMTDGSTTYAGTKTFKLGYVANAQTGSFVVKGHYCYISQPEEFTITFSFGGGVIYTPSLVLHTNMSNTSYSPFRNNQVTIFGLLDSNNNIHIYLKISSTYITSTFNVSVCQYTGSFKLYQNKAISGLTTWTAADFKANDTDVATASTLTSFTSANFTWLSIYDAGTGNVGIGTTTPAQKLHIVGTTPTYIAVNAGNAVSQISGIKFGIEGITTSAIQATTLPASYSDMNFIVSNTSNVLYLASNTNIGIGTNNPAYKLDVNVAIRFYGPNNTTTAASPHIYAHTSDGGTTYPVLAIQSFSRDNQNIYFDSLWNGSSDVYSGTNVIPYHMTKNSGKLNIYTAPLGNQGSNITWTQCMTWNSNGCVGVGTANPSAPLQVYNTANTGLGAVVITGGSNGTVYIGGGDVVGRMNGLVQVGDAFIAASPGSQDSGGLVLGPWTGNNKGIRINGANGNVGIGTTNPSYSLDVVGQVNCTTGYRVAVYNGYLLDDNFDTSGSNRYGVHMASGVTRLFSAGAYAPSAIALSQATGTGTFIDQLYINHAGQVGVGTSTPGYLLDVNGSGHIGNTYINSTGVAIGTGGVAARSLDVLGQAGVWASYFISIPNGSLTYFINFYNNTTATTIGSISGNGTTVTYATTSDYRRKENVSVIFDPLGTLSKLKPVSYNFIGETEQVTGFIAHELQEFIPYAVTGTKDEIDADGKPVYQCVDVAKVVPLLTACAQEFNKQIQANGSHLISIQESLEEKDKRILSLERKNATLEKDLLDLKADLERVKKFLGIEYI